jgi:hypothetical protein
MIVGPLTILPAFQGYEFRKADIDAMFDERQDVWSFNVTALADNDLTVYVTFDLNTLYGEYEAKVIEILLESPLVASVT